MLKVIVWVLVAAIAVTGGVATVFAQKYPSSPINLVIPMTPGDAVDVAGRLMAEEMSRLLKVPVVTQNKPGATGAVGTEAVIKSKKDGHVILFTNSASIIFGKILNPENVQYDPFKDLVPLGLTTLAQVVAVARPDAPFKDFKEFLDYARKNPGKVRCGNSGVGSVSEFNWEIVKSMTGVDINIVPFKGAMPAVTALLGGHVDAINVAMGPVISHIKEGKVKGLAISSRSADFPAIPTLKQLGLKQDLLGVWFAFFAPGGVSPHVIETLVPVIEKAAREPAISAKLAQVGNIQEFDPPERLSARMREEYRTVEEIARRSGMIK